MPTTGRLTGAVLYGALALLLAVLLLDRFGDSGAPKYWLALCGIVGVVVGWTVVGSRSSGRGGVGIAIGTGITGAAAMAFWVLFFLSGYDMIIQSMRGAYDGPVEAVIGVFEIMVDYAVQFYDPVVVAVWLFGGAVAGIVTTAVGQRYR